MQSMTYGVLLSKEDFEKAFERLVGDETFIRFSNDKRVGNCRLTCEELWNELDAATGESECSEESLDWASCVLYTLDFEWV